MFQRLLHVIFGCSLLQLAYNQCIASCSFGMSVWFVTNIVTSAAYATRSLHDVALYVDRGESFPAYRGVVLSTLHTKSCLKDTPNGWSSWLERDRICNHLFVPTMSSCCRYSICVSWNVHWSRTYTVPRIGIRGKGYELHLGSQSLGRTVGIS